MSKTVHITADVLPLPNGTIARRGQTVTLTDAEFARIPDSDLPENLYDVDNPPAVPVPSPPASGTPSAVVLGPTRVTYAELMAASDYASGVPLVALQSRDLPIAVVVVPVVPLVSEDGYDIRVTTPDGDFGSSPASNADGDLFYLNYALGVRIGPNLRLYMNNTVLTAGELDVYVHVLRLPS